MLLEYNQLDQIIKSALNVKDFKQIINVKLMTFNENFNPTSPYVMLNWLNYTIHLVEFKFVYVNWIVIIKFFVFHTLLYWNDNNKMNY